MPLKRKEIASKIHEEHKYLKQEMQKIRGMMNCDVSEKDFSKWRMDFIWILRDFFNDLQKHFDLEEEGGFMNEIITFAPRHVNAIERLEAEHLIITGKLNGIIGSLKKMDTLKQDQMAAVCGHVEELLTLLAEHEAAESDIIETAYLQDLGGGD